jgi:hypothetical protein
MEVANWLRSLGLERYEPAFRESEIDWAVLPELTDADLEKLGLSLGARKKLLKAIAGLSAELQAASVTEAVPPAITPAAERRQLTVMFIDLVNSTELSRRLGPEEMRDVVRVYQNAVVDEVKRFEGHIANFWGDGVLAYFGWPKAHEDEGERAVRAGLAIASAVSPAGMALGQTLAARVGITNDARRAAGDLEPGARHLLDPATLAFFALSNGFPRTPAWLFLPDYDEMVAADLLWRYGWTASKAGLAFDDWEIEHQREVLDVMKQMSAISGAPTPREARNGSGSGVQ